VVTTHLSHHYTKAYIEAQKKSVSSVCCFTSINIHQNKKLPSTQHRVVLIGDSNMRGYVSSLEPLLNSNYKLYSVMKPRSSTNELEKSATETISYLNHNDMIILCYGTNDFDQKSKKKSKKDIILHLPEY